MKKFISNIKTLAALLMAVAALAACSNEDVSVIDQPANPAEPKTYTMTIQASKGDAATTRGLYWNNSSTFDKIMVVWHKGEEVQVVQDGKVVGTLTAAASETGETTLTGELTGIDQNHGLTFYLHADVDAIMDYSGQKNSLAGNGGDNIENNYDFATGELSNTDYTVDDVNKTINIRYNDPVVFESNQAIVMFNIQKPTNSTATEWEDLYATKLMVSDKNKNTGRLVKTIDGLTGTKTYGHIDITPSGLSTASTFITALNFDGESDIILWAQTNDELYTFEKSNVTFEKGKYYKVTVKMHRCTKFPLKDITSEDTQFTGWYIGSSGIDGDNENYAYQLYGSSVMAVIAYVGKVPGYWDNFLAMSMHDSDQDGNDNQYTASWNANANHVGSYATNHPITIGNTTYTRSFTGNIYDQVANSSTTASNTSSSTHIGWRMPTITDWRYIFYGLCGEPSPTDPAGVTDKGALGSSNPLTKLNADYNGYKANLNETYYCTSSGVLGEDNVWYIEFQVLNYGPKTIKYNKSSVNCGLRPVFAY